MFSAHRRLAVIVAVTITVVVGGCNGRRCIGRVADRGASSPPSDFTLTPTPFFSAAFRTGRGR
jgi:hypothetical protein